MNGIEIMFRYKIYEKLSELWPVGCTCAEIGVWKGDNAKTILDILKPSKMYLIDPWMYYDDYPRKLGADGSQKQMEDIYNQVVKRFMKYDNVSIMREKSEDALKKIDYLDWIYIDGNHIHEYVKNDLELSWNIIPIGGYIIGDDYTILRNKTLKKELRMAVDNFIEYHSDEVDVPIKGTCNQYFIKKIK